MRVISNNSRIGALALLLYFESQLMPIRENVSHITNATQPNGSGDDGDEWTKNSHRISIRKTTFFLSHSLFSPCVFFFFFWAAYISSVFHLFVLVFFLSCFYCFESFHLNVILGTKQSQKLGFGHCVKYTQHTKFCKLHSYTTNEWNKNKNCVFLTLLFTLVSANIGVLLTWPCCVYSSFVFCA